MWLQKPSSFNYTGMTKLIGQRVFTFHVRVALFSCESEVDFNFNHDSRSLPCCRLTEPPLCYLRKSHIQIFMYVIKTRRLVVHEIFSYSRVESVCRNQNRSSIKIPPNCRRAYDLERLACTSSAKHIPPSTLRSSCSVYTCSYTK